MRKILFPCVLVLMVAGVYGQSVGMAPATKDLGTIEEGSSETFEVYLTSSSTTEAFTVDPRFQGSQTSTVFNEEWVIEPEEYSAAPIGSWIEFSNESYVVDPQDSETYSLPGGNVNANGKMEITINVPDDAEPGYRSGQLAVEPNFGGGSGAGTRVFGLARVQIAFRVPGEVNRRIELSDVEAVRTDDNEAQFVFEFRNTGTVTTDLIGGTMDIYDDTNRIVGDLRVSDAVIPPGETRQVESLWVSDSIEGGSYSLDGTASYRTGEAYIGDSVTVTAAPQQPIDVEEPENQGESPDDESGAPLMLILIVVTSLSALLYYSGFDITWILLSSGLAGITIFITTSGTSIYMLLVTYLGAGLVLYLQW